MKTTEQAFADNLRRCRKARGLTQKQLAAQLGYSEKAVSKWETGQVLPPTAALIRLGESLQISLDELLDTPQEPQWFLGIDGGATKTEFALCDKQGAIVRRVTLGSSNPVDIGMDVAAKTLDEGIRAVCQDVPFRKISLYAGLSGGTSACEPIRAFFETYRFGRFGHSSDADLIVEGGLRGRDGIVVIMGTGSIVFAQKDGKRARIGGYGYLFDDGGNGYSIGRDILHAVLTAEDGSGEPTVLCDLLRERTGHTAFVPHITDYYALGKRGIASLAPLAFAAAEQGDAVAQAILSRNMREIARLIATGRARAGLEGTVDVVFVGGLTKQAARLMPLIRAQLEHEQDYRFYLYGEPLVSGALLLSGAPLEEERGLIPC